VELIVYDAIGKRILVLANKEDVPENYEVEFDGANYPSGIYYYRLTAGDYSETKKMVLLR
jgi:hypothetical protein